MPAFRALLLDFDGTLVDSIGALKNAYRTFLQQFGKVPTDEEFSRLNGPPLSIGIAVLRASHGLAPSVEELHAKYMMGVALAYEQAPPAVGAIDLLTRARTAKWSTAIVTSNILSETERWLTRWNLKPFVDGIVSGDMVQHGKPHPEPYLAALELLDCASERAIAIEDSPTGIRSSTSAAIDTWALDPQQRLSRDILDLPYIAGVVANLTEVARKVL